jgi:hypothetical protein
VDPRPLSTETRVYTSDTSSSVKIATPELLDFSDSTLTEDVMVDLIFQDIGGQELINIVRSDIINGQNFTYQPIKNLSNIAYQYNLENLVKLPKTDRDYFKNFAISLYGKIPECGSGNNCKYVYADSISGDIVIDLINLRPEEQVEVQIISNIQQLHGTIYYEESS